MGIAVDLKLEAGFTFPQALLGALEVRDVGKHPQEADRLALRVQEDAGRNHRPQFGAIATPETLLDPFASRLLEKLGKVLPDDGRVLLKNEVEDRAANHLLRRGTQHPRHLRVHKGGGPFEISHPDAFVGRLNDPAKALLTLAQLGWRGLLRLMSIFRHRSFCALSLEVRIPLRTDAPPRGRAKVNTSSIPALQVQRAGNRTACR